MKHFSSIFFHTIPDSDLSALNECEKNTILTLHKTLSEKRTKGRAQILISRTQCTHPGDERTVIDIIHDDKPFLVDSIVAEINRHALLIDFLIHPYIFVKYDQKGVIENTSAKETSGAVRQTHVHIRLHRLIPRAMEQVLFNGLQEIIKDVELATGEWHNIRDKVTACRKMIEANAPQTKSNQEYCAFLDYIYDNNFTLLGHRYYTLKNKQYTPQNKSGLGLLNPARKIDFLKEYAAELPELFQKLETKKKPLHIFKINAPSTVHRRVPVDAITVEDLDKDGNVCGFHLLIGLFTSVTYSRSVSDIPYLRLKVAQTITQTDFHPGSHDDKALRHTLEKYPRDELFQIEPARLKKTALSIMSLQERQRIALFMRPDIFGKSVSCMIYIPRGRFATRMRHRFEAILERELGGKTTAYYTTLDDSVFARIILMVECHKKKITKIDEDRLEALLQAEGRAWDEAMAEVLNVKYGSQADHLVETFTGAFPTAFRETYPPEKALHDIELITAMRGNQNLELNLYHDPQCQENELRLKIYMRRDAVILSDVLPILENMGLRVISELPFEITPLMDGEKQSIWIHDFLMQSDVAGIAEKLESVKPLVEDAFAKTWYGALESDPLNKLVVSARMSWREIIILRAYVYYIRQIGTPFSQSYISGVLTRHPQIARLLIDIFIARLDPKKGTKEHEQYANACHLVIKDELEQVASLDEDRILRSILNLIESTLRTNYFQTDEQGATKSYLSFKIDSSTIHHMPEPRPYREIFVYSPRVEGIHLRGGPVARGGLRWSDRLEDYRTEVLGLMKAQMVKNAVIVPVGSKGGFVLKQPPKDADRKAFLAEGIACYKIFIAGLLDLTDNRKGAKIVPPKDVVRLDGDDPYLVVAADKGTASFSDIANGISQEYEFWLDDAFASGGSAGYDHKKMGITARGAWESVGRHFLELNHDIQTQEFDVIGVGDMGGDVFGNGMLLSEKIRLIGAFNHLHIFCDPNPDPAKTWKERKRLFDDVLGWDSYDTSKLSKGGRIYKRSDKVLTLTPEIQKAYHLTQDKVSPLELMKAMLKARCDLLWFGGIGTYIKGENESHQDVGDKANDAIRVNAHELHTKVIGEGANLAITHLGRIEFAAQGGALNADFIDNSGGVDSSDHEVNIKILLQAVMEDKNNKMDLKARNKLLAKMTETVAQHVLAHNRDKAEAISLMQIEANKRLPAHMDLITSFEHDLGLKRNIAGLPEIEDLQQRQEQGKGLLRPELAVLQAYATIQLTDDLLETSIPDDKMLQSWLVTYFPDTLHKDYKAHIAKHRLAREIIAMKLANNIVNRMGPAFVKMMRDQSNASTEDVVRAYLIAKDIIGLKDLWTEINDPRHKILAFARLKVLNELVAEVRKFTLWFLKHQRNHLDIESQVKTYATAMDKLHSALPKALPANLRDAYQNYEHAFHNDGFPKELAAKLARLRILSPACDIIHTTLKSSKKSDFAKVTEIYFEIGTTLHFDWLYRKAYSVQANDTWNRRAKDTQIEQLQIIQTMMCEKVLKHSSTGRVKDWLDTRTHHHDELTMMMRQLSAQKNFDLAMLSLATGVLRRLCDA